MSDTTTTETPSIQTLELDDGLTLGYRELGSGPPVLLLHGWPTSSFLWRRVMPPIARRNRVLALDLPGFGASDKPTDGRYNWGDFELAIDGFLDALGIDQVAIAGHDLGGPVAVHWLLANRERGTQPRPPQHPALPRVRPDGVRVREDAERARTPASATSDEGLAEIIRLGIADDATVTDGGPRRGPGPVCLRRRPAGAGARRDRPRPRRVRRDRPGPADPRAARPRRLRRAGPGPAGRGADLHSCEARPATGRSNGAPRMRPLPPGGGAGARSASCSPPSSPPAPRGRAFPTARLGFIETRSRERGYGGRGTRQRELGHVLQARSRA